jgi:hypothetical protein
MRQLRILPFAAAALAACLAAAPGRAATLQVEYEISLSGFSVGSADATASLNGDRYSMQIQARLTGLAGAITGGRLGASASGSVSTAKPLPSAYTVTSQSATEQRTVRLGMARGNVASVDIAPPIEDRGGERVPIRELHKRGVIDPVSALLMPFYGRGEAADPAACNRTLPVFDGAARFDIVLSYAETRVVDRPGYAGPVVICNARYVPIAGHRPDRPGTRFMQENQEISVWLAPVEGTRILVPMRITVKTMMGVTVIDAQRWTQERDARPIPAAARRRGKAARL